MKGNITSIILTSLARKILRHYDGPAKTNRKKDFRNEKSKNASKLLGVGSLAATAFLYSLLPYAKPFCKGRVNQHLAGIFQKMGLQMHPEANKQYLDPKTDTSLLHNFQLYRVKDQAKKFKRDHFDGICSLQFSCKINQHRRKIALCIDEFIPAYQVKSSNRDTHFRLVLLTGVMEPVHYFMAGRQLQIKPPQHHHSAQISYSEKFRLEERPIRSFEMLQERTLVPEEAILIVCVGIEFFEQYGQGQEYHAIERGRMKVGWVF